MYDELIKNLRGRSQFLLPHYGEETSYDSDLMKQAADAIEELTAYVALYKDGGETAMKVANDYKARLEELTRRCEQFQYMPPPAWIPVTERLPEETVTVIVTDGVDVGFSFCVQDYGDLEFYSPWKITHWMPLPEPPKEEAT